MRLALLFTDIEGSTRLAQAAGDDWLGLLQRHRVLLREAFAAHGGTEIKTEGDSFFVTFPDAQSAIAAAVDAQRALAAEPWPHEVRVRIGIHVGDVVADGGGDLAGIDVHLAARVCDGAHGGQIVVTDAVAGSAPASVHLHDLGLHRLRGLSTPQQLFQVVGDGLRDTFPPLRTLREDKVQLPLQSAPFVGRADELADLIGLLGRPGLVTVTGLGGTGKTRLALQAAAAVGTELADGAAFVDLANARDESDVLHAIAYASGVSAADDELEHALVEALAPRERVVLLDNAERALDAAPLLVRLAGVAPRLRLLVTSREALRVRNELELALDPLGVDDAIAMFEEHARAARPSFTADAANRGTIRAIVDRVDRLPLAIELVAARSRLADPEQLLARLDDVLDLAHRGRDAPDRQRTLRATLDWTFELLRDEERSALIALSVFRDPFGLDAAHSVAGADDEILLSLVEKRLVVELPDTVGRFSLLQTIREYGQAQLADAGALDRVQAAHQAHFAALCRGAIEESKSRETLIDPVVDDVLMAYERATDEEEWETALVLACGSAASELRRGNARRAYERVAAVVARKPEASAAVLGDAHSFMALSLTRTDPEQALEHARESLSLARLTGSARGEVLALGVLAWSLGQSDEALDAHEQAVELARGLDPFMRGSSLVDLGNFYLQSGRLAEAAAPFAEALDVFPARSHGQAIAATNLTLVELELGNLDAAVELLRRTLPELSNAYVRASMLLPAAVVSERLGLHEAAARLAGIQMEWDASTGDALEGYEQQLFDRLCARLRDTLGEDAFATEVATGRRLEVEATLRELPWLAPVPDAV